MSQAVKSILTGETATIGELMADAAGVLALSVIMAAVLWLPAILSA